MVIYVCVLNFDSFTFRSASIFSSSTMTFRHTCIESFFLSVFVVVVVVVVIHWFSHCLCFSGQQVTRRQKIKVLVYCSVRLQDGWGARHKDSYEEDALLHCHDGHIAHLLLLHLQGCCVWRWALNQWMLFDLLHLRPTFSGMTPSYSSQTVIPTLYASLHV